VTEITDHRAPEHTAADPRNIHLRKRRQNAAHTARCGNRLPAPGKTAKRKTTVPDARLIDRTT